MLLHQYPSPVLRRDAFDFTSGSGSWGLSMIEVDVRLFGNLRSLHPGIKPGEALRLTLPDEATIAQLQTALSIPGETVKIVFVNGVVCESGHVLGHGDRIGVFPPIAGGSVGPG